LHGTSFTIAWKIAQQGFAALSTLDAGFYGKGIYFSTAATYIIPYIARKRDPAVLICLSFLGNSYPVTEHYKGEQSLLGTALKSGYQSHYVITSLDGAPTQKQMDKDYYDELVIDQQSQVLPVFLLTIDPSNFSQLVTEFNREIPGNNKDRIIAGKSLKKEKISDILNGGRFIEETVSEEDDVEMKEIPGAKKKNEWRRIY